MKWWFLAVSATVKISQSQFSILSHQQFQYFLINSIWQNTGLCKWNILHIHHTLLNMTFYCSSNWKLISRFEDLMIWRIFKRSPVIQLHSILKEEFQRSFTQWKNHWNKIFLKNCFIYFLFLSWNSNFNNVFDTKKFSVQINIHRVNCRDYFMIRCSQN